MRSTVFATLSFLILTASPVICAQSAPNDTEGNEAGNGQYATQWSEPSDEGLQTRLVSITKAMRQGKPFFFKMEVRHKDGEFWARNTVFGYYQANIGITTRQNEPVETMTVRLRFNTMIPANETVLVGAFPAGSQSYSLTPGDYRVKVDPLATKENLNTGAVKLPSTDHLSFSIPETPEADQNQDALAPDSQQARELREVLDAWSLNMVDLLVKQGQSITPGLVALLENANENVNRGFNLPLWQYAAFLLGETGDRQAIPYLLKRIDDEGAMSVYFVSSLRKLRVKKAIPRLIHEISSLEDTGWLVMSSMYGSKASYLVEAIEAITGETFPRGEDHWPDKEKTLEAVNEWWAKQNPSEFTSPKGKKTSSPEE